ncbi:MAG: hypothetical protein LAQ30_30470, partial [Acidobacteriia bacterium]|nr:hypothetical protein [Terriglobia bacterium]
MSHRWVHRLLPLAAVAGFCIATPAQMILVERGLPPSGVVPPREVALRASRTDEPGRFVGDDFSVGAAGEVWVIDTLRTWVLADDAPGLLFQNLTLFGGLAGQPLTKEQAECVCHGVVAIKTAGASGSPDVSFSQEGRQPAPEYQVQRRTFRLWQIEFRNVRWSVPGGVGVQFALNAETPRVWFSYSSPVEAAHRLRVFDAAGQLRSFLDSGGNGINLQVWGHLSAKVAIRRAGALLNVILGGGPTFDVSRVETASLRLGQSPSGPVSTTVQDADGDGIFDLSVEFHEPNNGAARSIIMMA